jgi:hypothetical protein
MSDDGIDKTDYRTAMTAEDVCNSSRNEGVTEKVGTCVGLRIVLFGEDGGSNCR